MRFSLDKRHILKGVSRYMDYVRITFDCPVKGLIGKVVSTLPEENIIEVLIDREIKGRMLTCYFVCDTNDVQRV